MCCMKKITIAYYNFIVHIYYPIKLVFYSNLI